MVDESESETCAVRCVEGERISRPSRASTRSQGGFDTWSTR